MSLAGRTVVIAGANSPLGAALARDLAAQGANLALLGRNPAPLRALGESLTLPAARWLAQPADLSAADQAAAAARAVMERFGRVDALLHLVGGWTGGKTLFEMDAGDLEAMLAQHVWTSFHAARAFGPLLAANGWGRVVMISSPSAAAPRAKGGAYAAAKAGQEALALTLARELAGSGVTVNILHVRTIDEERKKVSAPSPENAGWTTPEEITAAVSYLLSEAGAAVNAARMPLYGG